MFRIRWIWSRRTLITTCPLDFYVYTPERRHNTQYDHDTTTTKKSPSDQAAFYQACVAGDVATRQGYHHQHFSETLAILSKHVDSLVIELDELSENSWRRTFRKGDERHPRLPLLLRHNEFVRSTMELVQQNLDGMASRLLER